MTEGYRSSASVPSQREPQMGSSGGAAAPTRAPAEWPSPATTTPGDVVAPAPPPAGDSYGTGRDGAELAGDSDQQLVENAGQSGRQVADTAKESGRQVADTAKEAGRQVTDTAKESGKAVADTAKEEAQRAADSATAAAKRTGREAKVQTRELYQQTTQELSAQARQHQERLASGLGGLAHELSTMADSSSEQGLATDLARQAADRAQQAAGWLEGRSPEEVLAEVKRFARRRPGAFVAIAGGLGLVAGRTLRGLKDAPSDDEPVASAQGRDDWSGGQLP